MEDFFKSIRFKILLGVLILLVFFMLRAAWTGGVAPVLPQVAGVVVTPLQRVSSSISRLAGDYFVRYIEAWQTAEENERLQIEVNELRQQLVELENYREENENLKGFLEIKERNPDFEFEPASITARDPNDRFYSFTIDKGTLDGVSPNDTVLTSAGLVGRVKEVGLNWAKVLTILDPSVNVGAYDNRTRDTGIVTGAVDLAGLGRCKLAYLQRESSANAGDLVVTSGGSIFPQDIVIGRIAEIAYEKGEISLFAVIEPAADIRSLTSVMVIKSFAGQEVPADDE